MNKVIVVLWIIVFIEILLNIALTIANKILLKKKEQEHKNEVNNLQSQLNEIIEEDKEVIEEILQETENNELLKELIKEEPIIIQQNKFNTVKEVEAIGNLPYSRKMLLTNYEYKCYKIIKPLADKYNLHIMSKVKLIDFITVRRGMTRQECYSYIGRIKQSHVDFVFCNPNNLYPLACLELDDSTHKSLKAQDRDSFKNQVFASAGIKLYRINNLNVDLEQMIKDIASLNRKSNC